MKKSLEEKILEIKEALEKEGIIKRDLSRAEYCIAQRIRKGEGIKEESADRLLSKISRIKAKRKKETKISIKLPLGVKEVEIENVIDDKYSEIKQSEENYINNIIEVSNEVKENDIDNFIEISNEVKGNSTELEKIFAELKEDNERLKQENLFLKGELDLKTKEIKQLLEKSYTIIDNSITTIDEKSSVIENKNSVIEKIKQQELLIKEALERIKNLEEKIAIEKSITSKEKNPAYHGFSLSKLASGYWQAVRRMEGKPQCIYIGRDVGNAQEKIEQWLSKNYPDRLEE